MSIATSDNHRGYFSSLDHAEYNRDPQGVHLKDNKEVGEGEGPFLCEVKRRQLWQQEMGMGMGRSVHAWAGSHCGFTML